MAVKNNNGRDSVRISSLSSMDAWLNDYKPKLGKYVKDNNGGIYKCLKFKKGKYKPKCPH